VDHLPNVTDAASEPPPEAFLPLDPAICDLNARLVCFPVRHHSPACVRLLRAGEPTAREWADLHRRGAAIGFHRFLRPVERLAHALDQKRHVIRWDARPAARAALEAAVLAHLAQEVSRTPEPPPE
jgi:hypothetical protein